MRTRRPRRCRLWVEELEGRLVPAMLAYSANWSGYALVGGAHSISYVSGAWNVPAVTGSNGFSATWVGIDGYNSRSVEQIGTESDYVNGQASYYAWYEMYPNPSVQISQPIQPGDAITASVGYARGSGFTLTINDPSWSSPFTTTIQSAAPRTSAEWVVEAPSARGVLPLANFGTESFSAATATVHGTTGSITTASSKARVAQVDMAGNRGTLKDTTSALNAAGTSFTVTFDSSGAGRTGPVHAQAIAHDTNTSTQVPTFIVIIVPTGPALTPLLINELPAPPQPPLIPPSSITITAPPPITSSLTLMDPFVGTPGVSDALPAGNGNAPGAVPAGPAAPEGQNGPVVPAGPQLRPAG